MIWTAFLWGLGVSCGSAFGLLLFCLVLPFVEMANGRKKKRKAQEDSWLDSLAELKRRNELTEETNDKLERLVVAVTQISEECST